jgi:hypothetical protein
MPEKYKDFPFEDVCNKVCELAQDPSKLLYQKFTCAGCGQRLTMDVPNTMFETGTCDKCPTVTDIKKQGCNFLMHIKLGAK